MQNYLLSHLLFDEVEEEEEEEKKRDSLEDFLEQGDEEEELLDPEYVKEMEKLLAFIDDKANRAKKKKVKHQKRETAVEVPKLKIIKVNNLRNKFETKRQKEGEERTINVISRSGSKDVECFSPVDEKVGKVKDLFESSSSSSQENQLRQPWGSAKTISSTIKKFDCPEAVERMSEQKEREREERWVRRLAKLEEEKRKKEEEEKLRCDEEGRRKTVRSQTVRMHYFDLKRKLSPILW